jgi:hypothetical protein
MAKGYTPTEGEVLFAGIDVAFTAWDLATLGGGAVASSTASTGLKTTAREGFREGMKTIGENLAKTAAKTELKEGSARVTATLLGRLAKSPKVVSEVARKGLYKTSCVAEYALRTAVTRRIPIRLMKYVVVVWTTNLTITKSLEEVAQLAPKSEGGPWAEKVKEVLSYLGRIQDTPLGSSTR